MHSESKGGSQRLNHTSFGLHCREALQPLHDVIERLHDLNVTFNETSGMIGQVVLLAQGLDAHGCLGQVVAGHGGEEVVLDLVVQATHEPPVEAVVVYVACGGDLQHAKRGGRLVVVQCHPVVADAEGDADQQATHGLRHRSKGQCMREGHAQQQGGVPHVVQDEAGVLQQSQAELALECALAPAHVEAEHVGKALLHPCQARKAQQGQKEDALVLEVPRVGRGLLQEVLAPRQEGHGVDVRVAIVGTISALVQVGDGVVRVVLVLPPRNAEALEDVANQAPDQVVGKAPAEDLRRNEQCTTDNPEKALYHSPGGGGSRAPASRTAGRRKPEKRPQPCAQQSSHSSEQAKLTGQQMPQWR